MNICDELRAIRERQSLEVAKMTFEERKEYFRKGSEAIRRVIEEKRKIYLEAIQQKVKKVK